MMNLLRPTDARGTRKITPHRRGRAALSSRASIARRQDRWLVHAHHVHLRWARAARSRGVAPARRAPRRAARRRRRSAPRRATSRSSRRASSVRSRGVPRERSRARRGHGDRRPGGRL